MQYASDGMDEPAAPASGHGHTQVVLSGGYHAQVFTLMDGWYATVVPAGSTVRPGPDPFFDHIPAEVMNRVGPCSSRETLQQTMEDLAEARASQQAAISAAEALAADGPDADDETLAEKLMDLGYELEESWAAAAFAAHKASTKAVEPA